MIKCSHCGQEINSAEAAAHSAAMADDARANSAPPTERRYVDIPSWQAFRDRCISMMASPNCTPEFRNALTDLPKALAKYKRLTEGQWKFFGVMHMQILGSWPSVADLTNPVVKEGFSDLDDIPF